MVSWDMPVIKASTPGELADVIALFLQGFPVSASTPPSIAASLTGLKVAETELRRGIVPLDRLCEALAGLDDHNNVALQIPELGTQLRCIAQFCREQSPHGANNAP